MNKKWKWKHLKVRRVQVDEISDRALLLNLYLTQAGTLILGLFLVLLEHQSLIRLFGISQDWTKVALYGAGLAAAVMSADLLIARWVPEEVTDDGGINEKLFRGRAVANIIWISLFVAVCEELLFRGAVQHALGPYWTSILFASIHFRYLRHWLMTGFVFGISYGLGWIMLQTGTIWCPIAAHFLIDAVMGMVIRFKRA